MASRAFQKDSGDEIISEINVIPLVDISLVLLIIFMVTASYIVSSSFKVDLPVAAHAKAAQQSEVVAISISREGPVYFENELVTTEELKRKIQAQYRNNSNISVVVSADKNVNFKNVVKILDVLSELGITKLNIAAIEE